MAEIAVCVATFRRPENLRRLLVSLLGQTNVDGHFSIVIVDNDPAASARPIIHEFGDAQVPIIFEVESDPGIPAARNRTIAIARRLGSQFVAFIDDDEVASPGWLSAFLQRIKTSGVDAVSGPVEPVFPETAPTWARESGLFHRATYPDGADLEYASTANSMLRLSSIADQNEPFRQDFRFTGGSDSFLYQRLRHVGGRIQWERQAQVFEYVPERRISMRWLLARSYRQGITLARCDRLIYGTPRKIASRSARGVALIPLGVLESGVGLIRGRHTWRRGLTRIARGAGSIAGLLGVTYDEYRR